MKQPQKCTMILAFLYEQNFEESSDVNGGLENHKASDSK